jgi:hypothetical protein
MCKRHMVGAAEEPLEFFDGEPEKAYGRKKAPVTCRLKRSPTHLHFVVSPQFRSSFLQPWAQGLDKVECMREDF